MINTLPFTFAAAMLMPRHTITTPFSRRQHYAAVTYYNIGAASYAAELRCHYAIFTRRFIITHYATLRFAEGRSHLPLATLRFFCRWRHITPHCCLSAF